VKREDLSKLSTKNHCFLTPPDLTVREGRQVGRPESGDPGHFEILIPFEGRGGNYETVFRRRPHTIAAVRKCSLEF
jgi:hypothetical protein